MTQIVRKFILLSILITILVTLIVILYKKYNPIETFGIRDINGRRNRALKKSVLEPLQTELLIKVKNVIWKDFKMDIWIE